MKLKSESTSVVFLSWSLGLRQPAEYLITLPEKWHTNKKLEGKNTALIDFMTLLFTLIKEPKRASEDSFTQFYSASVIHFICLTVVFDRHLYRILSI